MGKGTLMAGIAVGLMLVSYASLLYAYCLLRGYNVSPRDLFLTSWPPEG